MRVIQGVLVGNSTASVLIININKQTWPGYNCLFKQILQVNVWFNVFILVQSLHVSFSSVPENVNLKQSSSPSATSGGTMVRQTLHHRLEVYWKEVTAFRPTKSWCLFFLFQDLPKYAMTNAKRGVCMIINNYDFSNSCVELKNRDGTQFDEGKWKIQDVNTSPTFTIIWCNWTLLFLYRFIIIHFLRHWLTSAWHKCLSVLTFLVFIFSPVLRVWKTAIYIIQFGDSVFEHRLLSVSIKYDYAYYVPVSQRGWRWCLSGWALR